MSCAVVGDPGLSVQLALMKARVFGISVAMYEGLTLRRIHSGSTDKRLIVSPVSRSAHLYESFANSQNSYVVVPLGSSSELSAAGIVEGDPFQFFGMDVPIGAQTDVIQASIKANTFDSFLPAYQSQLYRIDKERREEVRSRIFAFLSGSLASPPPTGVPKMDELLAGPLCLRLRSAVIQSKRFPVEKCASDFDVDVFEIRYIRSNIGLAK